jgi:hypothetical protein
LLIGEGLFALLALALKLIALLALLIAIALLLAHGILARLSLTALAVVASLLRRASGVLTNLGRLRTRWLRLGLALFPLPFATLATLHAGVVFLLPVVVAATTFLRCGSAHAHAERDAQGKRPGGLLVGGEFHQNSLLECQRCSWLVDSSRRVP